MTDSPHGGIIQPSWLPASRDLEWEVQHKKSRVHKGRGSTPDAALRDLRESWTVGVAVKREDLEREQKRLDRLTAMLADTDAAPGFSSDLSSEASGVGNESEPGAAK